MKTKLLNNSRKLYATLTATLTLSIVTTIFLVSTTLYLNFENISLKIIHSFVKDSLLQISTGTDFMVKSAKTLLIQASFDSDINRLMVLPNPDIQETDLGLKKLSSYCAVSPYMHSIYLYNSTNNNFYTTIANRTIQNMPVFFDQDIVNIISNPSTYKNFAPIPRKVPEPRTPTTGDHVFYDYTFIYSEDTPLKNSSGNTIILNVSEKWMRSIINSLDVNPGSDTFIINNMGILVTSTPKYKMLTDLSKNNYIESIITSNKPFGYSVTNVNGIKSLVTYVSSESTGWNFVRITPYTDIMSKMQSMKFKTFLIGLLILVIGLLISIFISKKLYIPINNIFDRMRSLEIEKRKYSNNLKQEFLISFLQNSSNSNIELTKNIFELHQISIDPTDNVILIYFGIDHYASFCSKNNHNDRNLLKFGIMNIAAELSSAMWKNEAIDMGEDHIIILMNMDNINSTDVEVKIKTLVKDIQEAVYKYLELSLSAAISSIFENVQNIDILYENVSNMSKYRLFFGYKSIIFSTDMNNHSMEEFKYDIEKEKLLIDSLLLGKKEKTLKYYMDIINKAREYSLEEFNLTILKIMLSINISINAIERINSSSFNLNLSSFIARLNKCEVISDINDQFFNLFEVISTKLEEKKSSKYDDLINKTIEIIQNKYTEPNLSLDSVAEALNMSSAYLGRLFKKHTAKSIADYINEVRLGNAKELLTKTNKTINEIVENSGFVSDSYFYTIFKKENGVTPNEYRQATHNK